MALQTGKTPDTAEVAERMAILDILNLHSRGLDRLDEATIRAAYWPDAQVDYGRFKGEARVFANLIIGVLGGQYALTRHALSNTLVTFEGNFAYSETCVHAGHLLQGGGEELLFYGRYLDRLEKRTGHWKIVYRQVVMDWSKRYSVRDERDGDAFGALAKSGHYNNDPLYPFLANKHGSTPQ
ncbi:MAG: nuclear transport factor 2 family protein [Halioglobus sp.]|nr:nuclear transport factor 2 family protein [Halioglobus sp.]